MPYISPFPVGLINVKVIQVDDSYLI